ncbi:HEAT repeat domain-containing protein [Saprospiraceae bacterium]|nr:HEAT repeat domain-containing protein [Saprospiraceae bacterium]
MNRDLLEQNIIDYLNGELDGDVVAFENMINSDETASQLLEEYRALYHTIQHYTDDTPPVEISQNFNNFLEEEVKKIDSEKSNPKFRFNRIIGKVILLVTILGAGLYIGSQMKDKSTALPLENYTYEDNQASEQKMMELLDAPGISNRIKAVNMSTYMDNADDDIIKALSKTLLNDQSDHVRLAAVEALGKFADEPGVRETFLAAIDKEKDETVIIALINLLTIIKEKEAIQSFDKIIQNENSLNFVKNEAYSGKLKLTEIY